MKRLFDIVLSLVGLLLVLPLLLVVAIIVGLTSAGPALFLQQRIGKGFRPFCIYKFRTMVQDASQRGGLITVGEDRRITYVGHWLRKTKIDELPQLLNVLMGQMSFVGPRPEAEKYVEMFHDDYVEILQIRPGITDLASIKFRDEAALLGAADQPERQYVERILPEKIRLAKEYVRNQSIWLDLKIVALTLSSLVADRLPRRSGESAVNSESVSVQSTHNSRKANEQ